jgi:hypothetical protein
MRLIHGILGLLVAGAMVLASPACATLVAGTKAAPNLIKLKRTLAKEPVYKTRPQYCLLVFGAEADFRVWLVQDGETLYVDRDGNGDLTEPGEQVAWNSKDCIAGLVTSPDGKGRYRLSLRKYSTGIRLTAVTEGKQRFLVGDPDVEALVFADHPSEAPVAHIGGPLAIDLSYYESLVLRVRVGTPGLGRGAFAALVLPDIVPVAQIEFPSRTPGAPPLVVKATLKDR